LSHAPTSQVPRIHDSCHTCIASRGINCTPVIFANNSSDKRDLMLAIYGTQK